MDIKYDHRFFIDADIRSQQRFSQISSLSESEKNAYFNEVSHNVNMLSQNLDFNSVSQHINMLYQSLLKGQETLIPNTVFENRQFLDNLFILIGNGNLCFITCKLIARILYYTTGLGQCFHRFIEPLFNIFLANSQHVELDSVTCALCNIVYDAIEFDFEGIDDDHPITKLAHVFPNAIQAVQNRQLTHSFLLLVRYLSIIDARKNSFDKYMLFFISHVTKGEVMANNEFMRIVLWTLYDLCERRCNYAIEYIVNSNIVPYLTEKMKQDNCIFAEPIIAIFYQIIDHSDQELNISDLPFDIPFIFHNFLRISCDPQNPNPTPAIPIQTGIEDAIQYESLQFIHILTKHFPGFMFVNFLKATIRDDGAGGIDFMNLHSYTYKAQLQVLWIACELISANQNDFLDPVSLELLLKLILSLSEDCGDDTRMYLAIESINNLAANFYLQGKNDFIDQMIAETGAFDFIENMKFSDNEKLAHAASMYEMKDKLYEIKMAQAELEQKYPNLQNIPPEMTFSSDDSDDFKIADAVDDDDNTNIKVPSKIRFVYQPK
ncbi:hypothetical protein TRFO_31657 [Tritrichomonas foetus]|uniref:Uncharacterized protein n=1 Tax=Tritrichomonas foetus TaxID=1144522 RepID=A0A1J4JR53_9EUKA|nr:hypothetical protein TRFO_31657 [Tritrichomonas foetus]|eukprot:OHT01507.1 hypothetical protein TRFO_31657 [Tritrichomonas foetus]